MAVLATSEEQHQHQQHKKGRKKKTTSPRREEGGKEEDEEEGAEGLRKKTKKKRKKNEGEAEDKDDEETEDEIEKVDAATLAANMKKVPLIERDARGGGDPNFHGLKESGEEQGRQEQQQEQEQQQQQQQQQQQEKEATPPHSSRFRGVTKHKRSGRWEAHIWIRDSKKQVYLGGYSNEQHAAEAFDLVAMKCKLMKNGRKIKLNYPASKYQDLQGYLLSTPLEELIMAVRRQSQGFARGSSGYRGVTLHPTGRWEARIG